jgi:hypothetical protein
MLRRHDGFSVWTTKERAVFAARRYRELGRTHPFVAELNVPDDVRMEPFAAASVTSPHGAIQTRS